MIYDKRGWIRFSIFLIVGTLFSFLIAQPAARAIEYHQIVGNWEVTLDDREFGQIDGEIAIGPARNPTRTNFNYAHWFRSSHGSDNNALQNEKWDGSRLYAFIFAPNLVPNNKHYQRHMWITFAEDGLTGSGYLFYGKRLGTISLRKMIPEYTATVCCGVKHYGSVVVKDGVIESGVGSPMWVRLDGAGIPKHLWPPYHDIQTNDPALKFWRIARNNQGVWYIALWTKPDLVPGMKTLRVNGRDVPLDIRIRRPDGSIASGDLPQGPQKQGSEGADWKTANSAGSEFKP